MPTDERPNDDPEEEPGADGSVDDPTESQEATEPDPGNGQKNGKHSASDDSPDPGDPGNGTID